MNRNLPTLALCASSLFLVSFLWQWPNLLAFLLGLLALVVLYIRKDKASNYMFLISGLAGGLAESFAISFGTWTYGKPQLIGVPAWLFILWGIAAVFMVTLNEEVKKRLSGRRKESD
jgi:hypothetical protein